MYKKLKDTVSLIGEMYKKLKVTVSLIGEMYKKLKVTVTLIREMYKKLKVHLPEITISPNPSFSILKLLINSIHR